jgi:hypothetical protein
MLCLFQPVLGKADQPAGLAPRIPSPGIAELLEAEVLFLCGPKNPRSSDAVDRQRRVAHLFHLAEDYVSPVLGIGVTAAITSNSVC